MERLILLLLSPVIFAERHKINDPNDEPFLPIYPAYPYNPKLIKRGAEQELVSQLTSEPYEAPKEDAKDFYSASYSNNYQRESYYPNYSTYPKSTSPAPTYNPTAMYYNEEPYSYVNSPYATYNPYQAPYSTSPAAYPASSYPGYYYQPTYYYPHYFNHALFPPPPPPPPPPQQQQQPLSSEGVDYQETSPDSAELEDDKQDKDTKSKKPKEDETHQDASTGQFVDGGNYISGNSRDLDVQSSTYKVASPYNQLAQDTQTKNLGVPLPKTTYRVISVAGQPVGPNYPLPAQYVKAQQIEQLGQTLTTLLAQNTPQQADQSYGSNTDALSGINDGSYAANPDTYNPNTQPYVAVPGVRTKPGVTYVINPDDITEANGERTGTQVAQSHTLNKSVKYPSSLFVRKPTTQTQSENPRTTLSLSQVTYVPQQGNRDKQRDRIIDGRPANQAERYDSYGASLSYTGGSNQPENKGEQNYGNQQRQAGSYRSKDFVATSQTPRTYNYRYSAYESDQTATAQRQSQEDNVNSGDGNFGAKQYNKG